MAYYEVGLYFEDEDVLYIEAKSKKEAIEKAENITFCDGYLVHKEAKKITKEEYLERKL
jgi:hypothetical protein